MVKRIRRQPIASIPDIPQDKAFPVKDPLEALSTVGASDLLSQFLDMAQQTATQK
jgi:hypothetical protein